MTMELKTIIEDFAKSVVGKTIKVSIEFDNHEIVLPNYDTIVKGVVCEWLSKWMNDKGIENIHNHKQASPDFWLDKDNLNDGWLEVKSFTGSPNFDIGAFRGYINEVVENPWKLHAKYLLVKYPLAYNQKVKIKIKLYYFHLPLNI